MDIRIPRLGEGADSGTVVSILVKPGDTIKKDQTILELENEKAVAPIPSSESGVVSKIHVKVGDKVAVGQVILSLGNGQASAEAPAAAQPAAIAPAPKPAPAAVPQAAVSASVSGQKAHNLQPGIEPPAPPSVRKLAQELGIDLRLVPGSEAGGRITAQDLRNYIQQLQMLAANPGTGPSAAPGAVSVSVPPTVPVDFAKWGSVSKKPLSSLRQKISQKMLESWTTIPHVTQFDEADVTAVSALREKYEKAYAKKKARLTLTAFVLKACVAALKKYPDVNASVDDRTQELVTKNYYHIGVAVDTEAGLIVPVLRDVDQKSLLQISLEIAELAEKTRQRKVSAEDLKGGSFTVSNLGGIGGSYFTPIINKPEVAILGVGRGSVKTVYPKTGKPKKASMLPLSLSYDHRVIDGALGARFIREIAAGLENYKESDLRI